MKKYVSLKNISWFLLALFILFQFFRIDKTQKSVDPEKSLVVLLNADSVVTNLLKNSCYDCHSNQVNYPWYTNIAPISWWIKHHVNEGSHHLNFSEWGNYSARKADHKLEECVEMLEEGEMPLTSYTLIHKSAVLNGEQKKILIDFFNSKRTYESEEPKED